jgi:hypothetical protein
VTGKIIVSLRKQNPRTCCSTSNYTRARCRKRELLARVYGWFTEGFDALDLNEAKALLDELAL